MFYFFLLKDIKKRTNNQKTIFYRLELSLKIEKKIGGTWCWFQEFNIQRWELRFENDRKTYIKIYTPFIQLKLQQCFSMSGNEENDPGSC